MKEKNTAERVRADMPMIERVTAEFWQRVLDDALEDGRDGGLAERIIIQSMIHCGVCEYARRNGLISTADELNRLAKNFLEAFIMEQHASASIPTSKH